jgi:hypothetical protein
MNLLVCQYATKYLKHELLTEQSSAENLAQGFRVHAETVYVFESAPEKVLTGRIGAPSKDFFPVIRILYQRPDNTSKLPRDGSLPWPNVETGELFVRIQPDGILKRRGHVVMYEFGGLRLWTRIFMIGHIDGKPL